MPLPPFTSAGVLPPGIHHCTLDEVAAVLGWSNRRRVLVGRLRDYAGVLRDAWGGVAIILDGSFVTLKEEPNDVDLVVLLNELGLGDTEPKPHQSTSVNRQWVNRRYSEEIDLKVATTEGLAAYWTTFFAEVTGSPGTSKGLLRVTL